MVWEKYEVDKDERPRPIRVSKALHDAVNIFSEDKGMKKQQFFELSLVSLWRIWNGDTDNVQPASAVTESKVKNILINNPQPDPKKNEKRFTVHVVFKGEETFQFMELLEELHIIRGFEDGIRRILSWFLREQGYLEKPVNRSKLKNKLDQIDIIS